MNFKICFLLLPSRKKEDGTLPIYCRVSLNGKNDRFSTGYSVLPAQWNLSKGQVRGHTVIGQHINTSLASIEKRLFEVFAQLIKSGDTNITVSDVIQSYRGVKKQKCTTLLEVFCFKIERMKSLENRDYSTASIVKQRQMANSVSSFLLDQYDSKDILLNKVNKGFINDLEAYLKVKKGMKLISINKVVQSLKSVVMLAIEHEWMENNPFIGHRFRHPKTEVIFLKVEEVKKLEEFQFNQARLNLVKNIFLFSVYTGLHFSDAMSLTKDNLVKGQDGNLWIEYTRKKTDRFVRIPLFSKAKVLLAVFKDLNHDTKYLVPRFSNQKINSYLKEIGDITGIRTPLTHKVARKTFGSILLFYNTPIAVVSELMGHSSILITQKHYAKLEFRRLGEEINKIDEII